MFEGIFRETEKKKYSRDPQEALHWWVRKHMEYKVLLVLLLGLPGAVGCLALAMARAASLAQPGGSPKQGGTDRASFHTSWL